MVISLSASWFLYYENILLFFFFSSHHLICSSTDLCVLSFFSLRFEFWVFFKIYFATCIVPVSLVHLSAEAVLHPFFIIFLSALLYCFEVI